LQPFVLVAVRRSKAGDRVGRTCADREGSDVVYRSRAARRAGRADARDAAPRRAVEFGRGREVDADRVAREHAIVADDRLELDHRAGTDDRLRGADLQVRVDRGDDDAVLLAGDRTVRGVERAPLLLSGS